MDDIKDNWLSDPDPREIEEDDRLGSDGKFEPLYAALEKMRDIERTLQQELDRVSNINVRQDSLTRRIFTTLGF